MGQSGIEQASRGVFALPNEILLSIFNRFDTRQLLRLAPTCKHFHSLVLRLIHNRLQIAAGLDGHTLYLESNPPSAKLTSSGLFCDAVGTDGLHDILTESHDDHNYVGQLQRLCGLYSRFKPRSKEPDVRVVQKHPAGDIPGSRTWQDRNSSSSSNRKQDPKDAVTSVVTVDANDLFSQLTTLAYLGKRERSRGLLVSLQEVSEGTIRVWRDWLSKQCDSRSWSSGDTVVVHHEESIPSKNARGDGVVNVFDPKKDPRILWINTRDENVGIKFRVIERKVRHAPILIESELEMAVSYLVEYQEVFVRTVHLLLKIEEAQSQMDNHSRNAIVFGSFRGDE